MKKIITVSLVVMQMILPCIAYAQDSGNVDYRKLEMNAEQDAKSDLKVSKVGWTIGALGASVLLSPLLGGGATIIAGYSMGGDVKVPTARIGEIQQQYPDNFTAVKAYEDKYIDTYKTLKKKAQGKAAWAGTGIGFAINLVLISMILSESE